MKINLAKSNQGYNRTQWLLITCLCLIAFELGVRYSKKQVEERKVVVTRTITTNSVVTNLGLTVVEVEEPEELVQTNLPPLTNETVLAQVRKAPTNNYSRPAPGPAKEWVQPYSKPAESPPYKRKSYSTNVVYTTNPAQAPGQSAGGGSFGIRIVVP